jgi:hypothetical protein
MRTLKNIILLLVISTTIASAKDGYFQPRIGLNNSHLKESYVEEGGPPQELVIWG